MKNRYFTLQNVRIENFRKEIDNVVNARKQTTNNVNVLEDRLILRKLVYKFGKIKSTKMNWIKTLKRWTEVKLEVTIQQMAIMFLFL